MSGPKGGPREGGGSARSAAKRAGGGGGRNEGAGPTLNAGPVKRLQFLLFHVKLFFEGVRIDYKVVDIFRLVLYTFE